VPKVQPIPTNNLSKVFRPESAAIVAAGDKPGADVEHRSAEYTVLVADAWQKCGLGRMLNDYCLRTRHYLEYPLNASRDHRGSSVHLRSAYFEFSG
jgi:hypothetical protein